MVFIFHLPFIHSIKGETGYLIFIDSFQQDHFYIFTFISPILRASKGKEKKKLVFETNGPLVSFSLIRSSSRLMLGIGD